MFMRKFYSLPWKFILRALALFTLLVSFIWLLYSPGFEPLLVLLGGISSLLGSFVVSEIPKAITKEIEAKFKSSEYIFVWYSPKRDKFGLPQGIPSTPNLYIPRPHFEKKLLEAIKKHQIVSLEGFSGIGKTDIAIKVLNEINEKKYTRGDNCRILFFNTQPEISILNSLLHDASEKNDICSVLKYFEQEKSILVFDNFEVMTKGYQQLLANILKYTTDLKVLLISRTRIDWVFPDYPNSFKQVVIDTGFNENQARQFIGAALRGLKFKVSDDDFTELFKNSGLGVPRVLANYVATLRKSIENTPYYVFFEFEKPEIAIKNSAIKLLSILNKTEIGLIECMSIVRTPIDKDKLVLLYSHLFPLRNLFTFHKESTILNIIRKLTDEFIIDLHDKDTVKVHDSIREAINHFPSRTIAAHKKIARFYVGPYQIRPYNPYTISAKELTDKWNAVYHFIMGRMYEEAASVISEIYPFLSSFGLQEGADIYLEGLFQVLKYKVPWIAFLLAYRKFERGCEIEAYKLVEDILKLKVDERFKLRVLTLKAEILIKQGKEIEAVAIAESNARILKNVINIENDLSFDRNLNNIMAWNLNILATQYANTGDNEKSGTYTQTASEIILNASLRENIFEAKNIPGIPLFRKSPKEDVDADEEMEEGKELPKRIWSFKLLVCLIPLLCLGLFIVIKYDEHRHKKLYEEREKAFTPILGNIQDICSPSSISEAISFLSNGLETTYRTGDVLIYDAGLEEISILHHHALPDDLRANTPDDIDTVFCFWERKEEVGIYRNAEGLIFGRAFQIKWNIIGFDWNTGDVISGKVLMGGEPPLQGVFQGDRAGAPPSSNDLEEWILSLPDR